MIEFRAKQLDTRKTTDLEAYDEIYRTQPIRQIDSFYKWALELASPRFGDRILDVSCGVGRLVDLAARAGHSAIGIDLADEAIVHGHNHGVRGRLLIADALALPFQDNSFDCVINLGSIEHYPDPARGVAEAARVLRPDGRAVILLPNSFGYLHVLHVWRHGDVFDDGQPLQRYGTQADWRRLLESNGLRIVRVEKYQRVRPRTIGDVFWYLCRPTKVLQLLITPWLPINLAGCFAFICTRR